MVQKRKSSSGEKQRYGGELFIEGFDEEDEVHGTPLRLYNSWYIIDNNIYKY